MILRCVHLSNVRNYADLEFVPAPGLNVLVGANAQGKSNLLEAIAMLGTGKSFRTARESEIVRRGQQLASIAGDARLARGDVHLACTIALAGTTRKVYTVNGQSVRYANFLGRIAIVTFVPSDLSLVSGPPAGRRAFLNAALAQGEPGYYRELVRYQKALTQKSALLKSPEGIDPLLLATYDETLIAAGTRIILARRRLVATLADVAESVHGRWVPGGEPLIVEYAPNVAFETPTEDGVAGAFLRALERNATAERARRQPLVGPHRDEVALRLADRPLAAFGSQGQQRTAVLALKVAEYDVLRERAGEAPIFLLDDVLSELDPDRAAAFLTAVGELEQAFLTTTEVPARLRAAATFRVADAEVTACR